MKAQPGDKRLGNQFWMARYTHGRKPKIATPAQMRAGIIKYFEYLEDNPLHSVEVVKYQGAAKDHPVPKMRAPTLEGLRVFLGISRTTWAAYRERKGFPAVMEWAEDVLYDWKFQGAAADLLNANIIARDLGLRDRHDVTSDDEPFDTLKVIYV